MLSSLARGELGMSNGGVQLPVANDDDVEATFPASQTRLKYSFEESKMIFFFVFFCHF